MIINKLRLQEEHPMTGVSDSWPLSLLDFRLDSDAGENGYLLKAAQGLGPPDLVAIVDGFDSFGTPVMDSVAEKRDIVLKIGLNPGLGQSYGMLRDALYKLISRSVLVSLMADSTIIAQISGFIRLLDPVHFSNQPEIQITIECEDGIFSAPNSVEIPLTDIDTTNPIIVYEEGTAPTGFDLTLTVTATQAGFTISNHAQFWHAGSGDVTNEFEVTYPLIVDDVVSISTHPKNKRITLTRASVVYDLAGYINGGAVWPKLYTGVNAFEWTFASSWMDWDSASYIPRFWGV